MPAADPTTTRSARRSPATCAAAPATPRSSRRSPAAAGAEPAMSRRPRPDRGADQRQGPASRWPRPLAAARGEPPTAEPPSSRSTRPTGAPGCGLAEAARRRVRDPRLARSCSPSDGRAVAPGPLTADAGRAARRQPARPGRGVRDLADGPARPIAGGTDLMVALTGELGRAARARSSTCGGSTRCAGSRSTATRSASAP